MDSSETLRIFQGFSIGMVRIRSSLLTFRFIIYAIIQLQKHIYNYMPIQTISVKDFFESIGKSPRYTDIENTTHILKSLYVPIDDITTGRKKEVPICSKCDYIKGTGKVEIQFSDALYPYITHNLDILGHRMAMGINAPQMFGGIPTEEYFIFNEIISEFNNLYNSRLYRILSAYRGSVDFTLEELRSFLYLENTYQKYSHLKNRILLPTQELCKNGEVSDITFTFLELPERPINKQGKLVTGVRFSIVINKQFSLPSNCFSLSEEKVEEDINEANRGEFTTDNEVETIFRKA